MKHFIYAVDWRSWGIGIGVDFSYGLLLTVDLGPIYVSWSTK